MIYILQGNYYLIIKKSKSYTKYIYDNLKDNSR